MTSSAELKNEQLDFNETIKELQFSSGLDVLIMDVEGNVKASKLKYGKVDGINKIIVETLEKTRKVAESFSTGRVEECIVCGKNGYTIMKASDSHILVVSGLTEHQLGLALHKLRQIANNLIKH